jgi:lipopolysaccharide export system permease protein
MLAFLMERILRSTYLLSQTHDGIGFLSQLTLNLAPHYLGLTLPGGFFIGLFIVVSGLSRDSEVDAMLATGMSLGRLTAPLVGLGAALMLGSLALYGFLQPISWYAYHSVLDAANNAGWSGELQQKTVVSLGQKLIVTADDSDRTGRKLSHVFIRSVEASGRETVVTARSGDMRRLKDGRSVTLDLDHGQQIVTAPGGEIYTVRFRSLTLTVPVAPAAKAFRARGDEVAELTLTELIGQGLGDDASVFSRQALLAELYARIARAIALPLMPLLAVPLGLTAKRAGSSPSFAFAGLLLFAFETLLVFGHGLATAGRLPAWAAIGTPTAGFAAVCIWTFMVSRKRPGENPVSWLSDHIADLIVLVAPRRWKPAGP